MGNSGEVFKELSSFIAANPQVTFAGLTPNMKGLEGAMKASCKEVAIFAAASESFSKKNINMSIEEAMSKQGEVATAALDSGNETYVFYSYPLPLYHSIISTFRAKVFNDGNYLL